MTLLSILSWLFCAATWGWAMYLKGWNVGHRETCRMYHLGDFAPPIEEWREEQARSCSHDRARAFDYRVTVETTDTATTTQGSDLS